MGIARPELRHPGNVPYGDPVSVIAALITSGFVMPACCWVEKSKGVDQEIFK